MEVLQAVSLPHLGCRAVLPAPWISAHSDISFVLSPKQGQCLTHQQGLSYSHGVSALKGRLFSFIYLQMSDTVPGAQPVLTGCSN